MHEADYKTCTVERFLYVSQPFLTQLLSFFLSCFVINLWHCSLAGLFWAAPFDAGGGKNWGWGGALALPQVARSFYLHGPHWKTGPRPWHNSPQMFDSTKPLKLLLSQLLLNPCGCLGVPLVFLFLTCFVLCSVKVLLTALLQITQDYACLTMIVFFDFYFLIWF